MSMSEMLDHEGATMRRLLAALKKAREQAGALSERASDQEGGERLKGVLRKLDVQITVLEGRACIAN